MVNRACDEKCPWRATHCLPFHPTNFGVLIRTSFGYAALLNVVPAVIVPNLASPEMRQIENKEKGKGKREFGLGCFGGDLVVIVELQPGNVCLK